MTPRRRFLLSAGAWVVVAAGLLLAGPLAFRGRFPDPVASHWGPSEAPDGSLPLPWMLIVQLVLWAVLGGGVLVAASRVRLERRFVRAWLGAMLAGIGALLVGLMGLTVWANLDVIDWRAARPLGWRAVLPAIGVAVLAGWSGWLLARRGPDVAPPRPERTGAALRLEPGQRAVWVSSAASPVALGAGVGFLGLAAALGMLPARAVPPPWSWIIVAASAIAGVAGLAVSSVRVQVDEDGLAVAFGPLRWPVRRIPLGHIERAWTDRRYGSEIGWGYRGPPGDSTVMIRGGECLVVGYSGGRVLAVSVDDADRGAALLTTLAAERTPR